MEGVSIACGQLTWDRSHPRDKVLAEIAQAGYEGAPVGRSEGTSAKETLHRFARYGLRPAPGYLFALWTHKILRRLLAFARRQPRLALDHRLNGLGMPRVKGSAVDRTKRI